MLKALDLFSGTGGIAYALRGLCTTVAYVEIARESQASIRGNIARGYIDDAPIHGDIRTFDATPYKGQVDLVAFGSPCVGFSQSGRRQGFENEQSALFFEAARIVRECTPDLVIMENVASILFQGMESTVQTLDQAGYDCAWCCGKAWQVGAPQIRYRWFLVGYRRGSDILRRTLPVDLTRYTRHDWSVEPCQRMIIPPGAPQKAEALKRIGLVGNGVVPDCLRACVLSLLAGHALPVEELLQQPSITVRVPDAKRDLPSPSAERTQRSRAVREAMQSGRYIGGIWSAVCPPRMPVRLPPNNDLRMVPLPDTVPTQEPTSGLVTEPKSRPMWGTPRYSSVGICKALTKRGMADLGTQLRFEQKTPDYLRDGVPFPRWVEWLQGLPPDFSRFNNPSVLSPGHRDDRSGQSGAPGQLAVALTAGFD